MKTAEEMIKSSNFLINGTGAYEGMKLVTIGRCHQLMEEYAQQTLREELIKYDRSYWGLRGDSEKFVDEYLKKK
jgi:hypothetical protein